MNCPKCKHDSIKHDKLNETFICNNCFYSFNYSKFERIADLRINKESNIIKNINILPYDKAKIESKKFHISNFELLDLDLEQFIIQEFKKEFQKEIDKEIFAILYGIKD